MKIRNFVTTEVEGRDGWQMRIGRGEFASLYFLCGSLEFNSTKTCVNSDEFSG